MIHLNNGILYKISKNNLITLQMTQNVKNKAHKNCKFSLSPILFKYTCSLLKS
jgi:hypothetical protein